MLQESMQQEMVATVVGKLSEQMNSFDARQKTAFADLEKELAVKFKS